MKRPLVLLLISTLATAFASAQSAPPSVTQIYAQGRRAQLDGNNYKAIELYHEALQQNPSYLQPTTGLAETYFTLGQFSEALHYVRQAEKLDNANSRLTNLEGRIRIGLGEFDAAKKLFDRVLANEPNNVEAKFGLAEISIAQGQPGTAAASFQDALSIAPENKRALLSLVLLYDSMGDYAKAEQYTNMALDFHPNDAQVHYVAAKHYLDVKNLSEALKQAQTSLALRPGDVNATLLLSEIYLRMAQYDKVVPLVKNILAKNPNDYLLWYSLGLAYDKLGKVSDSIHSFAQAFSIQPADQISRIALESELINKTPMKDPRRAKYAQYHFDQGKQYQHRNYFDRALQQYRRGLLIDPYSMTGRLLYADIFNLQGFPAKYLNELEVLKRNGTTNTNVLDRIQIEQNLLADSVSAKWGVHQFTLTRQPYEISLYYTTTQPMIHYLAQGYLAGYFKDLLLGYENIAVKGSPQKANTFAAAFRDARAAGSEYFIVLDFNESRRSFRASAKLYVSQSGSEIDSQQSYRTGNSRVTDALANVASAIDGVLPLRGRLLQRNFDTGLIDLGHLDGVKAGDKLLVIKNGDLRIAKDRLGFVYPPDAVIGSFDVTRTDALVSEGSVASNQFFDLINPQDWVIFPPPKNEQPSSTPPPPAELYRNFLQLSGNPGAP